MMSEVEDTEKQVHYDVWDTIREEYQPIGWSTRGQSIHDGECWTLDVWQELGPSRQWFWDVSCITSNDYELPYAHRSGHAPDRYEAMWAAEYACDQMDALRCTPGSA